MIYKIIKMFIYKHKIHFILGMILGWQLKKLHYFTLNLELIGF